MPVVNLSALGPTENCTRIEAYDAHDFRSFEFGQQCLAECRQAIVTARQSTRTRPCFRDHFRLNALNHIAEEIFLVLEVMIERTLREPKLAKDVIQADLAVAMFGEHASGCLDDESAGCIRLGTSLIYRLSHADGMYEKTCVEKGGVASCERDCMIGDCCAAGSGAASTRAACRPGGWRRWPGMWRLNLPSRVRIIHTQLL